eukprot:PhF_6_TR19728/c0_g1_i1/m.28793
MPSKVEIKLQNFDEWMIRWRKFQTIEDWNIEKAAQSTRQRNYVATGALGVWLGAYTAAPSTLQRIFGPPHFFDAGFDVALKANLLNFFNGRRRFTPNGWGRAAVVGIPPFLLLAVLQHSAETTRWNAYLRQPTVFGEQARRYNQTGKIEEFLGINLQATLPDNERVIYAPAA